jgi:DNA-binding CsgD family transcriptional regulator
VIQITAARSAIWQTQGMAEFIVREQSDAPESGAVSGEPPTPSLAEAQPRTLCVALGDERFAVLLSAPASPAPANSLSHAESQVAELARSGLSNAAIAEKRGTSARTVANQLRSICEKLGLASRNDLLLGAPLSRPQLQDG